MGPGEIDVQIIRRHLAALRESLQVLAGHSGVSPSKNSTPTPSCSGWWNAVSSCAHKTRSTSRPTLRPVGAAMCRITPAPSTNSGASGCSITSFAQEFRNVAGFRNVLVHGYLDVDLDVLHELLHDRLGDFESFAAHVESYLESL